MKIITTPMCEDVLKIAGVDNYIVVNPTEVNKIDCDYLITFSETKTKSDKISVKLNSYTQLYESILKVSKILNTKYDDDQIREIKKLIDENDKVTKRSDIKVKVCSKFLEDTVRDMGYTLSEHDYDFVVKPDFIVNDDSDAVIIPSHKNVAHGIVDRLNERYMILESKLCMQQ